MEFSKSRILITGIKGVVVSWVFAISVGSSAADLLGPIQQVPVTVSPDDPVYLEHLETVARLKTEREERENLAADPSVAKKPAKTRVITLERRVSGLSTGDEAKQNSSQFFLFQNVTANVEGEEESSSVQAGQPISMAIRKSRIETLRQAASRKK